MSFIKPRTVVAVAGVVCLGTLAVSRMENFKTPGVRNIENRHSAAGGGHSHTPAHASPLGVEDQTRGTQEKEKGVGSADFQDKYSQQKTEASALGKKWNQTQYNADQKK